jgi:hypothetical protein
MINIEISATDKIGEIATTKTGKLTISDDSVRCTSIIVIKEMIAKVIDDVLKPSDISIAGVVPTEIKAVI